MTTVQRSASDLTIFIKELCSRKVRKMKKVCFRGNCISKLVLRVDCVKFVMGFLQRCNTAAVMYGAVVV